MGLFLFFLNEFILKDFEGLLGGSVSRASKFVSGHDLRVAEFEPIIRLTAVSPEPAWDPLPPTPHLSLLPQPSLCPLKK